MSGVDISGQNVSIHYIRRKMVMNDEQDCNIKFLISSWLRSRQGMQRMYRKKRLVSTINEK